MKMTQAQSFAEEMAKCANNLKKSNEVAAKYTFKMVTFKKHNDRKGFRFADGSKLFLGSLGKFELPLEHYTK